MNGVVCMLKFLNRKTRVSFWGRASGIERRKASLFESLRRVCHPLWQSGPILTAKGSNQALGETCMCQSWSEKEEQERWGLWRQGGAREGGWVVGQAGGGADVSRAEDELHAKTQSHRCLRYSLEQEGGGKENRNNITHSPAGHHTVHRLCSDKQPTMQSTWNHILNTFGNCISGVLVIFLITRMMGTAVKRKASLEMNALSALWVDNVAGNVRMNSVKHISIVFLTCCSVSLLQKMILPSKYMNAFKGPENNTFSISFFLNAMESYKEHNILWLVTVLVTSHERLQYFLFLPLLTGLEGGAQSQKRHVTVYQSEINNIWIKFGWQLGWAVCLYFQHCQFSLHWLPGNFIVIKRLQEVT